LRRDADAFPGFLVDISDYCQRIDDQKNGQRMIAHISTSKWEVLVKIKHFKQRSIKPEKIQASH
jgi:hypothetical protein